jgi:hypothetical protein
MKKPPESKKEPFNVKDIVGKLDSSMKKGDKLEDFISTLGQDDNVKEKILKEVVEKLVDPQYLLQFSRLDREMSYYICKHLIILDFFSDYYMQCECKIFIDKCDRYPFYRKRCIYLLPSAAEVKDIYRRFVNELQQLTIAYNGEGRKELISLFRSLNHELEMDDKKSGFLDKFGLAR